MRLFFFSSLEEKISFEIQDVENTYIRDQLQSTLKIDCAEKSENTQKRK